MSPEVTSSAGGLCLDSLASEGFHEARKTTAFATIDMHHLVVIEVENVLRVIRNDEKIVVDAPSETDGRKRERNQGVHLRPSKPNDEAIPLRDTQAPDNGRPDPTIRLVGVGTTPIVAASVGPAFFPRTDGGKNFL